MTVLIKYPLCTEKIFQDFIKRKDQELTNLDWAQWSGWWETDGSFSKDKHEVKTGGLKLKDRQPVELFSKKFETSLTDTEGDTITPDGKKYHIKIFMGRIRGKKAEWFTKNVYPFLISKRKRGYAAKLLGYEPESKDFTTWTTDEVIHYLATSIEGDGCVQINTGKTTTSIRIVIRSSDVQYLSDIRYLAEYKLGLISTLNELTTYKTKEGIKTKYGLHIHCSRRNPNNLGFFQSLVKDGVMTLDRKKQKVQEFVNHRAA